MEKLSDNPKILRELALEWLSFKQSSVKDSTYARYRHLYEKHIDPKFGSNNLKRLNIAEIETDIRAKQKASDHDGLAPKTIQDILSVYHLIIAYGLERKYLTFRRQNNFQIHTSTSFSQNKVTVMMPRERISLERYVLEKGEIRHFGIFLALYTGVRIGELCALKWEDVDLNNGILYINHTLQRLHDYSNSSTSKTRVVIGSPKTHSSARMIPLSSFLVSKLSSFASLPEHYMLTDKKEPEETRSYLYFYKRQLSACGLPEYTFHTIRHTFATRCVEEGIDIKSLSELLGHSNVKITMNRYVHPSIETKRQHLEKLQVPI